MPMLTTMRTGLRSLGYKVHDTRQEKIAPKELVVILDDVDIEIETVLTYHCKNYVILEWDTMDGDGIPTSVVDLVSKLENYIVTVSTDPLKGTFKFIQCEVNPLGQMYRVTVTIQYTEVINLG